ncbi:MAG: class I SAM-dependent methyltransferase [Terriglobia bacterium]
MIISRGWFRIGRRHVVLALALGALALVACHGQAQDWKDADKLATLLKWKPGSVVAEIGAGDGGLTLAAAERVGPTGRVYTTELDPKELAKLESLAAAQKAHNIIAIKAGEAETNLPRECCDSIFMRQVYHHLTQPAQEDASLFQSLKPGGLLAVIDSLPREGTKPPKGVPKNRGGHGMPKQLLVDELSAAGFQALTTPTYWHGEDYCLVFRKPD